MTCRRSSPHQNKNCRPESVFEISEFRYSPTFNIEKKKQKMPFGNPWEIIFIPSLKCLRSEPAGKKANAFDG